MLGAAGAHYHFEFTCCRTHPVAPAPTPEDLLVAYVPATAEWQIPCARMLAAGFIPVVSYNPYWATHGRTFRDPDGYRIVLQNEQWNDFGRP